MVRRTLIGAVLAVALAVPVGACGTTDSTDSTGGTATSAPAAPTTSTPPPPTTDAAAVAAVRMYFLRDGVLAEGEPRLAPGPDLALRALEILMAGPTENDIGMGLYSGIEARAALRSFSIDGTNATVDFTRAFETRDTQPQVAQVAYTLTQFIGLTNVTFLIDGEPNGATGVGPLTRDAVRADLVPPGA